MRIPAVFAAALALAPAARAQQPQSAGATDWFGRGIVEVRGEGTEIQLELRTAAEGMLLRLVEGERIMIVAVGPFAAGTSVVRLPPPPKPERVTVTSASAGPQGPWDTDVMRTASCLHAQGEGRPGAAAPAGVATLNGVAPPTSSICVSTTRQTPRSASVLRAPPREYLLLVLTDQPIDSTVTGRIRTIPGFDPATAAHDLAEYLVGRHSPMWAGYLARR